MPKVQVHHTSAKSPNDSLTQIQTFFENDADMKKIDDKIRCQFDPKTLQGQVTGSQFKANIQIKPQGSGSEISVIVDLPLLLTPFKGKIEELLKKKLNKHLA